MARKKVRVVERLLNVFAGMKLGAMSSFVFVSQFLQFLFCLLQYNMVSDSNTAEYLTGY